MNQTLDIASRILASLVVARPSGNPVTQAIDALSRAVDLLNEAKGMGIDISEPETTGGFTPPAAPADPKPLSFGAKRKS
jgi:hypothetical protein